MSGMELLQTFDIAGYSMMKAIVSILWQSSILLSAVGALVYFLRHRSPSVRFILLVSSVLIIPFLPFITSRLALLGTPQKEIGIIPEYKIPVDNTSTQRSTSRYQLTALCRSCKA